MRDQSLRCVVCAACSQHVCLEAARELNAMARVLRALKYGRIVGVMHWHVGGEGDLPDGYPMHETSCPGWVCECLMHSPFIAPTGVNSKGRRKARYAVIRDSYLRPLPGIEDPEQADERIPESEAA